MVVETTVATAGSTSGTRATLVSGLSISLSGHPLAVKHLAISQNPRGHSFGSAPLSSSCWGIGSGEPSDRVDPETSPRSCHSSFRRQQVLFCHLELQLQCHPDSLGLQGILPTAATFLEECTFIYFRYSFPSFPILLARVGGSASWSANAAVRATKSSP